MQKYHSTKQLKQEFLSGLFGFPDTINVKGVDYKLTKSSVYNFREIVKNGRKPYVVYATTSKLSKETKESGLGGWLIFLWGFRESDNKIIPYTIKTSSQHRAEMDIVREEEQNPKIIGDTVEIKLTNFTNKPVMQGKVDTGADFSSLNAERWSIDKERKKITFVNKEISPNVIIMDLVDQQPIQSADGGVQYRPVVRLNIKINDIVIPDVAFNLNNRSSMKFPILIGQNVLEKGKFLIDPLKENTIEQTLTVLIEEWDKEKIPSKQKASEEDIKKLYETLSETDISFQEIFRVVKTLALQESDKIVY